MTTLQPSLPGQDTSECDPVEPAVHADTVFDARAIDAHAANFGNRLRAAREAQGLDLDACAQALKLPIRILRKLEQGAYEGTDSRVYLASYLESYGRHLGVDAAAINAEVALLRQPEPPLIATGGVSHSRFLFDRYRAAATYVVLTMVIAVPTIWFGVRSTLDRDLSHLTPLDASPVAQQDTRPVVPARRGESTRGMPTAPVHAAPTPQPAQDQPLLASMAPFPTLNDTSTPPQAATPAVAQGAHSLSLELDGASWVAVTQQDGTRLEYGLLPAGSSKTWHSDQPLDVRIGNAQGAQVSIDGTAVALDAYQRANVAHFQVQIADGKASAANL
ncbi:MAG: helix-turn-helix domain-containing protein [Rhodanobacter sp.]|nr:MAG: helix-turn-helix domain-containing protein [Rhodanobacter sp.]TAM12059.1 MAG: helix-turn-helix domain-containing protein [Rhodanobacter sp.]TAM34599.1 MAG: helix-turn-helix domain-containing protein [Rhodanobacter sp.]